MRIMFFDFSSAACPAEREKLQVNPSTIFWITDYLTNRPQFRQLLGCVSERVVSSTGAPQGTVVSSSCTPDFHYNCHLQKLSDISAVVGCVSGGEEAEHRGSVKCFVVWEQPPDLKC